jgi:hypothetical protein
MRQKRVSKRGRLLPLIGACIIGYLIGAWHVVALRDVRQSAAAEAVALRFPREWSVAPAITVVAMRSLRPDAELFSPVPMVPPSHSQSSPEEAVAEKSSTAAADQRIARTASLDGIGLTAADVGESSQASSSLSLEPPVRAASPVPARLPVANRPGYVLDNTQIASIKARLHLTPDQERLWPAVEAALRNMAYQRRQQVAARGGARNAQTAAVDPDAVQGLKSAAVPLIMSFSAEQKQEVRSIAHVIGLDQFATQF